MFYMPCSNSMKHLGTKTLCEKTFMNCQLLKEHAINVLYVVFKFKGAVPHKNLCEIIFMICQLL